MGIRLRVEGSAWILLALLILLLPLNWVLAAILAAAVHECSHLLMMHVLSVRVYEMRIGARGSVLEAESMTNFQELLCALAGPAGSFLMLALIRIHPRVALCGLVQGAYNLFPLLPLDGGRVLSSFLCIFLGDRKGCAVMRWIQTAVSICLFCGMAAAGVILHLWILVMLGGILGVRLVFQEKALAKKGNSGYNSATNAKEVTL